MQKYRSPIITSPTDQAASQATNRAAAQASNPGRRRFIGGSAAIAGGLALSPWFSGPALAQPKRGGHFRIGKGHGQTTDSLDPGTFENGFMSSLSHAIHGHMTEVAPDGTVLPLLAESWETNDDATVWTFKLRPGLKYHNGDTLTSQNVIASIDYHRGENSTSAAAPLVAQITDMRADGDNVVVFELSGGNADFPFLLSDYHLAILPLKDGKVDFKSGNGLGTYKLDSFEPGVKARLSRNEEHWLDDRGFFDSIEMLVLIDPNARMVALQSGEVDAIDKLDLKTVALFERQPNVNVHSVAGTQHFTFAMSTNKEPYTDNNVRMALKHAINRQELVDKILYGYGEIGNDHPISRGQRFYNSELAQTTYDPDKARWYLKQSDMDTLQVNLSASDAAYIGAVDAAVLYQAAAAPAGITIKVVREPGDGYWSNVWMKKPFSAVYWSGRPVEDAMLTLAYKSGVPWNDTFYSNETFDQLLDQARAELDEDKRREMYWELQAILNQDGGAVIPMFANFVFATNSKVGTPETFATNQDVDGERWAERWWFV
ncbi:MAG: peptide ABC transporter substrate-binding protein [Gammaproteobacteria bacterium]|nr:MAG: peptide ABC transporter substrate-binding protein [Gammaproteobacteria bacterium]